MKRFYNILLALSVILTGSLMAELNPPKTVTTNDDFFLWLAFEQPAEFDPVIIKDPEREKFIDKGIALCRDNADKDSLICQMVLSKYCYEHKCYDISNYWSYEIAKRGEIQGMVLLASSYCNGFGVVRDWNEAKKWIIIASSKGCEKCKQIISNHEKNDFITEEDYQRAKDWVKKHPDSLFVPQD